MRNRFSSRSWSLETVVGSWLAVALSTGFSGCSPGPETQAAPAGLAADPSALSGEFITYVADFDDGHSERWQTLRQANGQELRLDFDAPPSVTSGQKVWIKGDLVADKRLHVTAIETGTALTAARVGGALSADDPELIPAPTTDSYAIVLVDLGGGVNTTAAQAQARLTSTVLADRSFATYYNESSYGKYNVTGTVLGPYPFTMTTCDNNGTSAMATAIEALMTAAGTPSYNHLIYYFNRTTTCAFSGLGEEGSTTRPSKRTWMNGSLTCVVLMQEPGHNLGLMHANTMTCGGASFSTTPATSCTITEYGSQLTTMGSGCRTLNGYERWYMQWMAGCNGVKVPGSGTFNLLPLENSCPGGIQTLQIPFPAPLVVSDPQSANTAVNLRNYYLELRTQTGSFDTYAAPGRNGGGVAFTAPTVFVYVSDDVRVPAATGRGQNSVWTELINTTPTGTAFTGLTAVGQTFADPAGGPTITLTAISASGATISVTNPKGTGSPTCIDGTALAGSGPAVCGGASGIGGAPGTGTGGATGGGAGASGAGGARGTGGVTGAGTAGASGTGPAGASGAAGAPGNPAGLGGSPGGPVISGTGGSRIGPETDAGVGEIGAVTGGCGCSVPGGSEPIGGGLLTAIAIGLLRRRRRLS
jgi:MYXO-CTERM domain-containing protein